MNSNCGYKQAKANRVIQGLFYYFVMALLAVALMLVVYWQVESDSAEIKMAKTEVTLTGNNKAFFVPLEICNNKSNDFILLRRYKNLENDVYYNTPDGIYRANFTGCATTYLQAFAGNLEPGVYEYTIFIRYDINVLRTVERQAAQVLVTIK